MTTGRLLLIALLLYLPTLSYGRQSPDSAPAAEHGSNPTGGVSDSVTIVPGRLTYDPLPKYPEDAAKPHTEGDVLLDATISKDGKVTSIGIDAGDLVLADAAVDAVREWKFEPYTKTGNSVEVWQTLEFHFAPDQTSAALTTPLPPPLLATSPIHIPRLKPTHSVETVVGGEVTPPKATWAPDPEYTKTAKDAKREGFCVLSLIVGADGKPHDIHVVRAIGFGLDAKAVATVSGWRFEPGTKNGVPVDTFATIEVNFHLY